MTVDRVGLHRRTALGKWEAYAKAPERRHIVYGDGWIYAPDAVMMCPLFNGGMAQSMADLSTDEVASAMAD